MLDKIEHVGVRVEDLEQSIAFYTDILGLSLVRRESNPDSGLEIGFIKVGESELELLQFADVDRPSPEGVFAHLAFTVEDLDGVVARLREKDVEMISDVPREVFDGQVRVFFFKGPDGETLELWESQ